MSERVQKEKQSSESEETVDDSPPSAKNEELAESTNDLLDEIDDVLEENAEEFVKSFIQKGGE